MPQAVLIACPESIDLANLSVFARELAAARGMSHSLSERGPTGDGRVVYVSHPERRDYLRIVELLPREEVADELAERDWYDPRFRAIAATLRYYSVTFAGLETVRDLVARIFRDLVARDVEAWMDTDFGELVSAREAVRLLDRDPEWDWRPVR